jgi:AcrR family transcriptional regulator
MRKKSRKERERDQRKKEILDSAEKLFFKSGYDNVSMNDIANDVELNKATLYLYFENKEELFFASVLRGAQIMISLIKEEISNSKTGVEMILSFVNAYNHFVLSYPDYYRIYIYFQSGRFDLDEIVNKSYLEEINSKARLYNTIITSYFSFLDSVSHYAIEILNIRSEIFNILTNSIENGIKEGSIRKSLNPIETAVMLILMVESAQNIKPDFMKILETNGTSREQFKIYLEESINHLILKNEN